MTKKKPFTFLLYSHVYPFVLTTVNCEDYLMNRKEKHKKKKGILFYFQKTEITKVSNKSNTKTKTSARIG